MTETTNYKTIFIFSGASLLLLIFGLIVLLVVPKAIELADTDTKFLGNQTVPQPNILGETIDPQPKPVLELINNGVLPPVFTSNSVFAQDFDSGEVLYAKNEEKRVPPASTTKIMTALVASQHFKPADVLIVPKEALVGGSSMKLAAGEELTFRSLLYGMLLNSGNDAAYTIAMNYPGGYDAFIEAMNQKSLDLGLKDTHFVNPAGFDNPDHYSSASDLAVIAKQAVLNPQLARIVATKETSILSIDKTRTHLLKNLNKLLSEEGVLGIKTGTTELAGENLVALFDRNDHKVLTVVLGSENRFGETKNLTSWVYSNYTWKLN